MRITIKPFASAKDAAGFASRDYEISEGSTVRDILAKLLTESPGMNSIEADLLYAVNSNYCTVDTILHDKDILAIFPPVSGG